MAGDLPDLEREVGIMRDLLIKAYLEWRNDYLSVSTWADHNGMTTEDAKTFLKLAMKVYTSEHPEA